MRNRWELLGATGLIVWSGIAGALAWPTAVRTPLAVLAAVAVLLVLLQRFRGLGLVHIALIGIGGSLMLAMLVGLTLNYLPWGLSTTSWSIGVALTELAALAIIALVPAPVRSSTAGPALRRRLSWAGSLWTVAVLGVLAGALVLSTRSYQSTHVQPLALSMTRDGATAQVAVSSGAQAGPYELDLVTDSGRTVLARAIVVMPGVTATAAVDVPAATRGLLQLVPDGGGDPLRELIVDDSLAAASRSTG